MTKNHNVLNSQSIVTSLNFVLCYFIRFFFFFPLPDNSQAVTLCSHYFLVHKYLPTWGCNALAMVALESLEKGVLSFICITDRGLIHAVGLACFTNALHVLGNFVLAPWRGGSQLG